MNAVKHYTKILSSAVDQHNIKYILSLISFLQYIFYFNSLKRKCMTVQYKRRPYSAIPSSTNSRLSMVAKLDLFKRVPEAVQDLVTLSPV